MTAFLDRVVAQALGIAPVVHRRREPIFAPAKRNDAGDPAHAAFEKAQPFDESLDAPRPFRRHAVARARAADGEQEAPDDGALALERGPSRGGDVGENRSVELLDSIGSGAVVAWQGQSSTSSSAPFALHRDGKRKEDGARAIVPTAPIGFAAPAREQAHPEFANAQTIAGDKGGGGEAAGFLSSPDVADNRRSAHERRDPQIAAGRTRQIVNARRAAFPEELGGSVLDTDPDGPKSSAGPPQDAALFQPGPARSDVPSAARVASPRSVADELTINVSIGRIDVAPSPPPPTQQPSVASLPRPSLADYMELRQKIRGR